jgi:hypothetical protein
MVPDLRGVIEHPLVILVFGGGDNFNQRGTQQRGIIRNQHVGFIDISLVMLAMVIIKGFGRNEITKGGFVVRQVGENEGHCVSFCIGWFRRKRIGAILVPSITHF